MFLLLTSPMRPICFADVRSAAHAAACALLAVLAGCAATRPTAPIDELIPPSAAVGVEPPAAALQRAAARADARWPLRVVPPQGGVPAWSVTSARDGFVYVLKADADGRGLSVVYPRAAGDVNRLRAGSRFELALPQLGAAGAMLLVGETALRAGDLMLRLDLGNYAAAACLRNLGSDDCPSSAAGAAGVGTGTGSAPWIFGAVLLPAGP
jgi:hypothetical protein